MEKEQLNELSIFSLRELARRTGVNSPTSKKKDELINEIISIRNGEKKPYIPKTKQGRPPKNFGYDVNMFNPKTVIKPNFPSKILVLNQPEVKFAVGEVLNVYGVVEVMQNGSAFLWEYKATGYKTYYMQPAIVSKFNILSGDVVMSLLEQTENQIVIKDVLTINGCPALKFERGAKSYLEIPHQLPTPEFEFDNIERVEKSGTPKERVRC